MAKRGRGGHRPSCVSVEGAEFFKVFLPDLSSHQLLIPPDFTKDFRRTMKEKVILKNKDGKVWYVDVKETPVGVFLKDGWESFVHYHGLKVGEFLVFRYQGRYSFVVQIFGINGCKKESLESENIATHVKSEVTTDDDMRPKETSRKCAAPQGEDHSSSVDRRSKRLKRLRDANDVEEEDGASEQPDNSEGFENTMQVVPRCPFFVSPPLVSKFSKVRIPTEVMKDGNVPLDAEMILCNAATGKEWPVRIFTVPNGTYLGKGLFTFQTDNNIGPNDTCKFTFATQTTIDVDVFRNSKNTSRV